MELTAKDTWITSKFNHKLFFANIVASKCTINLLHSKNNDGWSPCSVQDFTSYANRFGDDYCLAPIKDSNTGDEDNKEDEDSNNQSKMFIMTDRV